MKFDQITDKGQPYAQSWISTSFPTLSLVKPLKDIRKKLRRYANTSVTNSNLGLGINFRECDNHTSPRRSKFDSIRKQIPDYLLQSQPIPQYLCAHRLQVAFNLNIFRFCR